MGPPHMISSGMSLGKRLTLRFDVIIAFMASLAVLSSVRIAGLNAEIGTIFNDRYPKTNTLQLKTAADPAPVNA